MKDLFIQLLPLLVILGAAVLILLIGAWWKDINKEALVVVSVAVIAMSIWFSWNRWLDVSDNFTAALPMITFDNLALISFILFAVSSALAIISSHNYIITRRLSYSEYISLILFAVFGAYIMACSANLIAIFIGLETLSLTAYVLAGYNKGEAVSHEASIKYFVLGTVASAIFLFGIAFYYGATGTLDLVDVAAELALPEFSRASSAAAMLLLSSGLIIAGLGFKIAAVPFQWWTPDVYEGSPLPVTAFFATTIKAAAFVACFRIVKGMYNLDDIMPLISVIAIATMIFGNLSALFQENIKRMLAYSSIAHAGYILLAFVFIKQDAVGAQSSMMFYLLSYILMTLGAFTVLTYVSSLRLCVSASLRLPADSLEGLDANTPTRQHEKTRLVDFAGLGRKNPWLALTFTLFLISLAGFPPTAGFFAKFYLFKSALQNGYTNLVIIAVLNSLVSVYYYMRPVIAMYFGGTIQCARTGTEELEVSNYSCIGVIIFCTVGTLFLGILPSSIITILQR